MTEKQGQALIDLLTRYAGSEGLRSVSVTLRLAPGNLDALPPGYIAGEITREGAPGAFGGERVPRILLAFGISPEGEVSS